MAKKWMQIKSLQDVFYACKADVPKLLGFKDINLYILDKSGTSLYGTTQNEENSSHTFESQFTFDPLQVIHFPKTSGLSGFCFSADAILYSN
jgi:hypothetical protein